VLSLAATVVLYRHVAEDWRGAVSYLIANSRPGDRVLYYQAAGEFAGENYRDWLPGGSGPRPRPIMVNPPDIVWQREMDGAGRVWLVLYRSGADSAEARAVEQTLEQQYRRGEERRLRGVTVVEYVRR